jgi:hypothetical protein
LLNELRGIEANGNNRDEREFHYNVILAYTFLR